MTIAGGIALIVVGAILTFALTIEPFYGIDLHIVGVILILAGILGLVLPLLVRTRRRSSQSRHQQPPGRSLGLGGGPESDLREAVAEDIAAVRTDDQYFRNSGRGANQDDL